MRARPELALALAAALAGVGRGEPARDTGDGGSLFEAGKLGNRKEPITVTSDTLEYDYKNNVVVYRGDVLAVQGDVKLKSDRLTVTLERSADKRDKAAPKPEPAKDADKADGPGKDGQKVREIVAEGNVRIDSGTRWATGGKATFEQSARTLVLTDNPKLHDGSNEVAGDRVVVFLDEDRSIVEGGRKRVKAVLYPGKDGGLASSGSTTTLPRDGKEGGAAPVVAGDARPPAAGTAGP